jgi:hypothetical protein
MPVDDRTLHAATVERIDGRARIKEPMHTSMIRSAGTTPSRKSYDRLTVAVTTAELCCPPLASLPHVRVDPDFSGKKEENDLGFGRTVILIHRHAM